MSFDAEEFDAFEAAGWASEEAAACDTLAGRVTLNNAGLENAAVEPIDFSLRVESAEELCNGLVEGTVRVRPLVVAQSDEAQWAIRARFEELLEEHRAGDGFEVPVAVKLGSGREP